MSTQSNDVGKTFYIVEWNPPRIVEVKLIKRCGSWCYWSDGIKSNGMSGYHRTRKAALRKTAWLYAYIVGERACPGMENPSPHFELIEYMRRLHWLAEQMGATFGTTVPTKQDGKEGGAP